MQRVVLGSLIAVACALGTLIVGPTVAAQTPGATLADVRGDWAGDYTTTIGVFPNTFHLTDEDFATGAVHGTANAGVDTIVGTVTGDSFDFTSTRPGYTATSTGNVSVDGSFLKGTASDTNGTTGTYLMTRTSGPPGAVTTPGVSGAPAASAGPVASVGPGPAPTPPPATTGALPPQPGGSPPMIEYVLPGPLQISLAPQDIARSVGIMTFIMLLVGAPTPIFNSTLSANRVLIERWARRRRPAWLRRMRPTRTSKPNGAAATSGGSRAGLSHTWPGLFLYLLLATFVYAFLDASFPGPGSAQVLFTTMMAIAIGTAVSQLPEERYVRTRYASRGTVDVALWTIILAAGCVVITRVSGIQPGYVYGIIGGFTFTVALSKDDKGRMAFRGMGVLLIVGVAAWFARIPFQPLGGLIGGDVGSLANVVLAGVFVSAVQGAAIALIPLRFLAGDPLLAASRRRWVILWGLSLLLFAHVILYPVSSFRPQPSESGLWSLVVVVAAYAAVALGFWWFFRRRAIRRDGRRAKAALLFQPSQPDDSTSP